MKFLMPLICIGLFAPVALAAEDPKDPPFKWRCQSKSTRALPKGGAGAGNTDFTVYVDPAAQRVIVNGEKHKAKIDKAEIAFGVGGDHSVSISRSRRTFGLIVIVKGLPSDEPPVVLHYEGACEPL